MFGENQMIGVLDMQNRIVRIDHIHSRAICDEVADRLRIVLTKDVPDIPGSLKSQIVRLRRLDQSPSIVPSSPSARRGMKYRGIRCFIAGRECVVRELEQCSIRQQILGNR